jgi:EAL domain-containing protein (putative c-di-GMP-specific phosphodiesterase class I)
VVALATEDEAIVRSTIDMAHKLQLKVVAEGVESPEVQERLRVLGCDAVQGLFIAPPAPAAEVRRWILSRKAESI